MKVNEIMSRSIQTLNQELSIQDASYIMNECSIGFIPLVNEENNLVSVITDRDIVVALGNGFTLSSRLSGFASKSVQTINEEATLDSALSVMSDHQIKRLVVTNDSKEITGVITLGDISKHNVVDNGVGITLKQISYPTLNRKSNPEYDTKVDDFIL